MMSIAVRQSNERAWFWLIILLVLGCVGAALGRWQWLRADYKQQLQRQSQAAAVPLSSMLGKIHGNSSQEWLGRRVFTEGVFVSDFVGLLDNQLVEGIQGVDVIGVVHLDTDQWIVVNRGWMAWADRNQLPDVAHPAQRVVLTGRLFPFSQPGLKMGEYPTLVLDGSPQRLPWVDSQVISKQLGVNLVAAELRLVAEKPPALVDHWTLSVMPAEKHRAYAWQWWSLTLLVWGYALWWYRHYCRSTKPAGDAFNS